MFERFTERARQVMVLAKDEAHGMRHSYIGTEHVLLGLLREEEGLAARVLGELGVTVDDTRRAIERLAPLGDVTPIGNIPFTPRAKKVLELALREALSLGHNYVGTEHLLLALVRENDGVAARILLDLGEGQIRGAVIAALPTSKRKKDDKPAAETRESLVLAQACLRKVTKIVDDAIEVLDAR